MSTTTQTGKESPAASNGKTATKPRRSKKTNTSGRKSREPMPWDDWSSHLSSRTDPQPLVQLAPQGKNSPLLWGWLASSETENAVSDNAAAETLQTLHALCSRKSLPGKQLSLLLETWLSTAPSRDDEPSSALQALAWCHALPRLAECLPSAPWWQLYDYLVETARDAAGIDVEKRPLSRQLLAGELSLTLAYLFPEMENSSRLASTGAKAISQGLLKVLDGEGLPHCRNLPQLRALLACWTRCGLMLDECDDIGVSEGAEDEYDWLVTQVMRLSRADGSQVFSSTSGNNDRELLEAALQLGGDADDRAIAAALLPGFKSVSKRKTPGNLLEAAAHSEWGELAVMRSAWSRSAQQLAITYGDRKIVTELNLGNTTFWSGQCDLQIQIDGKPLAPSSDDWEEICWHSDEDVDYIELELELTDGIQLQRQYVLARDDRFLYTADALLGVEQRKIEYRRVLPLCDQVQYRQAEETQEVYLQADRQAVAVLPLALSEWRGERGGSLQRTDAGLQYTLSAQGHCLYAPLFFDLHPTRSQKRLTWRRLTVAEELEIQPADVAVGYRVHVGHAQWLIYRSLGELGNRSLMGQNFSSEFYLGRFQRNGETEELLEIGGPEE